MQRLHTKRNLWISVGVLFVAAMAIFSHADDLSMWFDELWSMFQYTHSIKHILHERELNWPPAYGILLHSWIKLISANDFVVHTLGALIGLLGVAFAIQAGKALQSKYAGWLAGLVLGTSSYTIYFWLEARGYGLVITLEMAFVWLYIRWTRKPTWSRAIPYTLAQIALLYTHFSCGLIIALTALNIAVTIPRRLWWRGAIIMTVTAGAFLPLLPQFWDSYQLRKRALSKGNPPAYLLKGPESIYQAYSAHHDLWWALILVLAGIGLGLWIWHERRRALSPLAWLLVWGIGIPVYAYLTRESEGLFTTRYLVFTLPAVMLLVGIGLAALPRRGWIVGAVLILYFATFPWQPFDHRPGYSTSAPPVRDFVREMAQRFKPGDRLVIDPAIKYGGYDWWYYEPLYFQGGYIPQAVDGTEAGERVWYLVRQGRVDKDILHTVESGRIATEFWGPWYFIATLYEGPPLSPGYRLGDDIRFRGHTILTGQHYLPGDTLQIETWWAVDSPPPVDYSIGLHLIGPDGTLIAQADSGPTGPYIPPQTSAWQPGQVYRDDRQLHIPWCLKPGNYEVQLVVYQWWDGTKLEPETSAHPGSDASSLLLDTIQIDTFSYCEH
jgi:mannosyltransferase